MSLIPLLFLLKLMAFAAVPCISCLNSPALSGWRPIPRDQVNRGAGDRRRALWLGDSNAYVPVPARRDSTAHLF